MKKDIHPEYRKIVFKDASSDFAILTHSSAKTKDTIVWEDGQEYPMVPLDISSGSHPFYTGKQSFLDTAGRIDRLEKKFGGKMALGSTKGRKPAEKKLTIREKLRAAAAKKEEGAAGTDEKK
jgi:large subunit ribosomal protein L31